MRHLLKLSDWSKEEILEVLDLADKLKDENKRGIEHHHLKGKTLGMIFSKASTKPSALVAATVSPSATSRTA